MKSCDWITIIAYIVALCFYFYPEISAYINSLNFICRVLLTLVFLLFPMFPSLYYRCIRPKELSENFPFDPFNYYPGENMKSFDGNVLPIVELFATAKGLSEDKVDCRFGYPKEFKFPQDFEIKALNVYWDKLSERLGKEGRRKGSAAKARLFDLEEDKKSGILVLYFQKTEYWRTLVTNFFLDWKGYGEHLREVIAPKPKLNPLRDSILSSNHLGLNCILLTKDKKIILQERSKEVIIAPESIGLSSEGALGWEDRISKDNAPSPFIGMLHQLHDELGITREQIEEIKLIAIYRNLYWGGKPQALFIARTNCTFEEINRQFKAQPESAWETKRLIPLNKDNLLEIKKYLERDDVSFSAKVGLHYYIETLESQK